MFALGLVTARLTLRRPDNALESFCHSTLLALLNVALHVTAI